MNSTGLLHPLGLVGLLGSQDRALLDGVAVPLAVAALEASAGGALVARTRALLSLLTVDASLQADGARARNGELNGGHVGWFGWLVYTCRKPAGYRRYHRHCRCYCGRR